MSAYDWSAFTKRINVKAPVQTAYDYWTTQDGIEKWFLRVSEFTGRDSSLRKRDEHVRKSDKYRWLWFGYPDTVVEFGEILEANGKDQLKFTFGGASDTNMTVTVDIKQEEGETIVELKQEDIPVDENSKALYHIGCMEGWTFYLANLKSILEGGVDLRNKNEKLQKVINS
jgi:uncharacterized protein YndB with AHSA1/START domain